MEIRKHIETTIKLMIVLNLVTFILSLALKFSSFYLTLTTLLNAFFFFVVWMVNKYAHLFDAFSKTNKILKSLNKLGGF